MQEYGDRDDEGRTMILRYVRGEDPWDVRRRNRWLWFWLLVAIAVNFGQGLLLLALVQALRSRA